MNCSAYLANCVTYAKKIYRVFSPGTWAVFYGASILKLFMPYNVRMTTEAIRCAIDSVLSGKASLHAAAKALGRPSSNLRYWIMKNPKDAAAYAALQAANPDRHPLNLERLSTEELVSHPAVLAIVNDGMTYAKASETFGVRVMTLHGWVKKLYPEGIGRKRGRRGGDREDRSLEDGVALAAAAEDPDATTTDPTTSAVLTPITASIQAAAAVLGLTYHQVLAKLLEQAPPPSPNQPLP